MVKFYLTSSVVDQPPWYFPLLWTHFITFFESSSTVRFCETQVFSIIAIYLLGKPRFPMVTFNSGQRHNVTWQPAVPHPPQKKQASFHCTFLF